LRDVFNEYRAQRGEEDDGISFADDQAPLSRLDVFIYRPTDANGLTSFATIGMAAAEMPVGPGPGDGGRAELHLRRRGQLAHADEQAIALQLANLATHPFITGTQLNWGHLIGVGDDFPTFPGCRGVFLSGPLSKGEAGYVQTSAGAVRVINVVPITDDERDLARALPPLEFVRALRAQVDVFAGRTESP
jgi:hypothetical protein